MDLCIIKIHIYTILMYGLMIKRKKWTYTTYREIFIVYALSKMFQIAKHMKNFFNVQNVKRVFF